MNEFPIRSRDGLLLAGYEWPSQHSKLPCALLILIHGLAEHSGRYEHLVKFYNKNNFAIVSMDLRGHGNSAGPHVFIATSEAIFQDMDLLIKEAKKRYPMCPAILYGHSMGGSLVLSYTLCRFPNKTDKCPYQAVIATSPWIRLTRLLQPPRPVLSFIRVVCRIRPSLNVPLRFDPHTITRDEDIIASYGEDGNIRRSATLSLARTIGGIAMKLDRSKSPFHISVLIEHGDADAITSHNASSRFCERRDNVDFKSWPNCYHELHSEPEREEIFHYTLDWIREKLFPT
jgi:alpha-beta hydrolase superfamily lysophospholipase